MVYPLYLLPTSLGAGALAALAIRYLGDFPFPWEIRSKEYNIEKRIKEIKRAKRKVDIRIPEKEFDELLSSKDFKDSLTNAKNRGVKVNIYYPKSGEDLHFMIIDDENMFVEDPHVGEPPLYFRSFKSKRIAREYKEGFIITSD